MNHDLYITLHLSICLPYFFFPQQSSNNRPTLSSAFTYKVLIYKDLKLLT